MIQLILTLYSKLTPKTQEGINFLIRKAAQEYSGKLEVNFFDGKITEIAGRKTLFK